MAIPRSTGEKAVSSSSSARTVLSGRRSKRTGWRFRAEGARWTEAMADMNQSGAWLRPEASSGMDLLFRDTTRRMSFSRPVGVSGVWPMAAAHTSSSPPSRAFRQADLS